MSDEGERTCPLCAEEMDLTDQQLRPCKCGYEICVWCWHHVIDMAEKDETEGRCPACRVPYDKERIVGMAANCERMVSEINAERKQKPQKAKPKTSAEARKQLSSVRVVQRNLVYIIGMPSHLADESMLERREYFGQYGKVLKVSISRSAGGAQQTSNNNTFSLYITYSKEEEAIRCIQAVHNFVLEGKTLRACFGTTKYCHTWLRNMTCSNPDCLYLHDIGCQEDSFTKDEIISAYTRSRVPQIASNNLLRRSGNVLPPPADDFCISGTVSTSKLVVKTSSNNPMPQTKNSPPSGTTAGSVAGRSTVLPAAASWGLRANCRLPVSSTASLQGSSKQKPEQLSYSCVPSPVVAATKHTSAWHDGPVSSKKTVENSGVMHLESRCRSLESSRSIGRDSWTAANASTGLAQKKTTSAWYDDDDDVTMSRLYDESHATHLDDRPKFLESSKSLSRDSQASVLNTKEPSAWSDDESTISEVPEDSHAVQSSSRSRPFEHLKPFIVQDSKRNMSKFSAEIIDTKQTSAWDDEVITTTKMSEEDSSVHLIGRQRYSEAPKSFISKDSCTPISDLQPEIFLDTSHISISTGTSSSLAGSPEDKDRDIELSEIRASVTAISCSPNPVAPKDKDTDVLPEKNQVPANKVQPEDLYYVAAPDKVTGSSAAINGNIQDFLSGLSLRNPGDHSMVCSPNVDEKQNSVSHLELVGLPNNPVPELQQFYYGHDVEHLTSVPSSKAPTRSEEAYALTPLSNGTSEPQKQISLATSNEIADALSSGRDHRLGCSEIASQPSYFPCSSQSLQNLDLFGNCSPNSDFNSAYHSVNKDCRIPAVNISEMPLIVRDDTILFNGHDGSRFSKLATMGKMLEGPNINSSREDMKCLGRLNDLSGIDKTANVDMGENNIISNILSMDFDPWDDSSSSANNFAKLLGESDKPGGSLRISTPWKVQNSNQSRFSFARQESQATCSDSSFTDVRFAQRNNAFLHNSLGDGLQNGFTMRGPEDPVAFINSSHSVISSDKTTGLSRAKTSAPPGFSVPNRAPPPGFSSQERLDQSYDTAFSENLLLGSNLLRNQYQAPVTGNTGDVEFIDPAILAVGEGRLPLGLSNPGFNPGFGLGSSFPTQLNSSEGDPRLQLLMQHSLSANQDMGIFDHIGDRFSPLNDSYINTSKGDPRLDPRLQLLMQHSLSANQDMRISDHLGDRFSPLNDSYISSRLQAQNHSSSLPFAQMSLQPTRNSLAFSSQWDGWNDVQSGSDVGLTEVLRNERRGLDSYFPGNENVKFHIPSSGNLYNRAFGM